MEQFFQSADQNMDSILAFQLDGVHAALLHHAHGGRDGGAGPPLIAAEGQVADEQRAAGAARHRPTVRQHLLQRDGQCRVVAVHHHRRRIAHQQHIYAGLLHLQRQELGGRSEKRDYVLSKAQQRQRHGRGLARQQQIDAHMIRLQRDVETKVIGYTVKPLHIGRTHQS